VSFDSPVARTVVAITPSAKKTIPLWLQSSQLDLDVNDESSEVDVLRAAIHVRDLTILEDDEAWLGVANDMMNWGCSINSSEDGDQSHMKNWGCPDGFEPVGNSADDMTAFGCPNENSAKTCGNDMMTWGYTVPSFEDCPENYFGWKPFSQEGTGSSLGSTWCRPSRGRRMLTAIVH